MKASGFILAVSLLSATALTGAGLDKTIIPWSFKALKRPAVPQVAQADWPRSDTDRFILSRLEASKLLPSADAPRWRLIRRATLDLHGLLPTPQEVIAFEKDPRPTDAAFADVVDRLLKSPRFGERWARHWLDVARYADSTGRSWNAPLVYAFKYRNWVIDALNDDMPYTRFMTAQVAGDLLPAKDDAERARNLLGTGFLGLGSMNLIEGSAEQFVMDLVDDQIDVTTRAFLGLTVACARCHDHKYDPITQHDYYAFAGFFYSTNTWAGTADKANLGANLYVDLDRLVTLPAKGLTPAPSATTPASPAAGEVNLFDEDAPTSTGSDSGEMMSGVEQRDNKGYLISYAHNPRLAMGVSDGDAQDCPIRIAGDPYQTDKTPKRGDIRIPSLPAMSQVNGKESGRAQLADWLTKTTHPLTSRVMANRIWLRLFGRGLVTTVDDFGITGERPSHPELLDHLAIQFVTGGWSVKKFIREIMLSRVYRQDSAARTDGRETDPDNVLLWRMSPKRVEAEVMRDTLLQTSGLITYDRPAPIQVAGTGGKGNTARTRSLLDVHSPYRTIYLPVLRDLVPSYHETWDFPNPTQIRGQREVTTVPSQSLFIMNDPLVDEIASELADRVNTTSDSDDARIHHLHRLLFARDASAEEMAEARDFLAASPESGALAIYAQALLGGAEFRYAW